jgi:beta-glucosidase-like glycosyl hydrolase
VNTTLFPQVSGLAATGNLSLVRAMAEVMSTEARALNNMANGTVWHKGAGLNYWGPTMNVARDPRCEFGLSPRRRGWLT